MGSSVTSANAIHTDLKIDEPAAMQRPDRSGNAGPAVPVRENPLRAGGKAEELPGDPLSPDISESLAALNELLSSSSHQLTISVDPASGAVLFRIIDSTTGDVVLQVPSVSRAGIGKALILRRGLLLDINQ
jgi:uncharacterized FlaG/YvyC family protein